MLAWPNNGSLVIVLFLRHVFVLHEAGFLDLATDDFHSFVKDLSCLARMAPLDIFIGNDLIMHDHIISYCSFMKARSKASLYTR
jgi:hypothetical protein